MALISFGKQGIDELNIENERLRVEVVEFENVCSGLQKKIQEKDIKFLNHKNYIKQGEGIVGKYEQLISENWDINFILNNPERSSKVAFENLKLISEYKAKEYSYRQIAKKIHEATGQDIACLYVRYLYKKYTEKGEQ